MEITEYLTECVKKDIPVSFSKYGDGEFYCAFQRYTDRNCDGDMFTDSLSNALKTSFQYMSKNSDNAYFGLWHNLQNKSYWEGLTTAQVKWAKYHSILLEGTNRADDQTKVELWKAVKQSRRKKIIIGNPLLVRAKELLNADYIIHVPFNSWFNTHFNKLLEIIKKIMEEEKEDFIIITCCGMSAKVLICELFKAFPRVIYLDFGSALDLICTKKDSRGFPFTYEQAKEWLHELIPETWEDDKYNTLFEEAKHKMGIHLH